MRHTRSLTRPASQRPRRARPRPASAALACRRVRHVGLSRCTALSASDSSVCCVLVRATPSLSGPVSASSSWAGGSAGRLLSTRTALPPCRGGVLAWGGGLAADAWAAAVDSGGCVGMVHRV